MKIEIWGQFVNLKNLRGQIIFFLKILRANLQYLKIYRGQIENFEKLGDKNAKFEKYNNEEF